MKLTVYGAKNEEKGSMELPAPFHEPVRQDLIQRGFLAVRSRDRQPYGAKQDAGLRPSAELSRRRRKYRGSYGFGISRVPRKILSRRGTRMHWIGAVVPGTVGGRRAHPPKATKRFTQKINTKERRKALRSALAATLDTKQVQQRHRVPEHYPFLLDNTFEGITKTKDLKVALEQLGLKEELARSSQKKVRAGKGKARGRKYKRRRGPLLVVSDAGKLKQTNLPGVDVINVKHLNTKALAPGGHGGRLTLYTQNAINAIKEEQLFQ